MARKQKIKKRKFKAILVFAATILFSFLLVILPVYAVNMGEIRSGETKSGNIAIAGQTDSFKFYGKEGEAVVIKMVDINDLDFFPRISLYDLNNKEDRWTRGPAVAIIENHQLKQTGVHTIVIQDNSINTGEYTLSLTLTGNEVCPFEFDCCASESGYEIKLCPDGYHCEPPHKCVKNRKECPYECCVDEPDYRNESCPFGISCIDNECVEYEVKDKTEDNKVSCENNQVIFQGKCVEISSFLKKDEERISKEEYKLIIEKFNILKKEDKEELEKLAAYLDREIQKYLDKHEYEEAKRYTSLLEMTYYQLGDKNKVDKTKKKYKEIKKEHFMYKLTHPFNDPLEVYLTIIFDIVFSSFYIIKKFREKKISLFKFILKYWYSLILFFILLLVILWAAISVFFTMLK